MGTWRRGVQVPGKRWQRPSPWKVRNKEAFERSVAETFPKGELQVSTYCARRERRSGTMPFQEIVDWDRVDALIRENELLDF